MSKADRHKTGREDTQKPDMASRSCSYGLSGTERQNESITLTELFQGYEGGYKPEETDWGLPEGKEFW